MIWMIVFSGCSQVIPHRPPLTAQNYWGKPTIYILAPQPVPEPSRINLAFITYTWWPTNPVPFRSFAFCPMTWWMRETVGCLYIYDGVKIDGTLDTEGHMIYGIPIDQYVYEFKGAWSTDDHSEQGAIIWSRTLDAVCTYRNMARC